MRSNASIPALLALAVLCFSPACSLAKITHHSAHKPAAEAAPKHAAPRKATAERVRSVRKSPNRTEKSTSSPTVHRVRQQATSSRPHLRHAVAERKTQSRKRIEPEHTTLASAHQKATSDDFLKAAGAKNRAEARVQEREQTRSESPIAIHGTSRPDEPVAADSRSTRSSARLHNPASRAVSVVSVVRPAIEKPALASVEQTASTPVILPTLYNKRGRLIVPPPLKGSHEILVHQNEVADRDGLGRIQNDADLAGMRNRGFLVALPTNSGMQVDERLPENRRFCRPWTAQFLATLARAHYAHFHTPLQVNSAVRTVEFQQHLMHINGNAAPAEGDTASPHLTGQAIDIAKHGLSLTEIAWMRGYLLPLVQEGKVDVEEEFQQSCFHISVYKRYLPSESAPERDLATHRTGAPTLAAAMR